MCSGRVSSFSSTSGICRVTLVKTSLISHEWRKDRISITTNGEYPWSIVKQSFRSDYFNFITKNLSLLAATLYHGNHVIKAQFRISNIGSTERGIYYICRCAWMLLDIHGKFTIGKVRTTTCCRLVIFVLYLGFGLV